MVIVCGRMWTGIGYDEGALAAPAGSYGQSPSRPLLDRFFRLCGQNMKMQFIVAGAIILVVSTASAQSLRVGINEDPDLLDPASGKSFVGRIVFQSLCDKLVDISPDLKIVPRLATSWEITEDGKVITFKLRDGVTFQDGEKFDAAAVKFNIERAKTMPKSIRKSELASVDSVDAVKSLTVRFALKKPELDPNRRAFRPLRYDGRA